MRVLLVNNFAHLTGGADQHCFGLARALRGQGHEVRFLSTDGPRNVEDAGAFVRCTVTNATRDRLSLRAQLDVALAATWNREAAGAMKRLLDEFQPDVVHAHKLYPQLSVAPLMAAHRRGLPIVQTVHDHEFTAANPFDEFHRRVDRIEARLSYRALNTATGLVRHAVHARLVDTWIAVSTYIADTLGSLGISAVVLRNFVDSVDHRSLPGYERRSGVVFISRLGPEKGVRDALELARRLPTIPVTIAGDGELAKTVREEAARLPNLRYVGFASRSEVGALLRGSRITVMPSRWNEGGPLSALEAMAHGVVPVVYPAGGLAEYVRAGGGAVVDPDPVLLADAVMRLHEDRSSWNSVSQSVLTAVAEGHTPSRYLEQLVPIYQQLVVRARQGPRRRRRQGRGVDAPSNTRDHSASTHTTASRGSEALARRIARPRRRRHRGPGGLVLMYHRVAPPLRDPQLLCVHPERFHEQLEALQGILRPVRLQAIEDAVAAGKNPDGFAVTFDDGYADNLHTAKPILERLDIPATVFVASGYLGGTREFWWDELERILLTPGAQHPDMLRLRINGKWRRWQVKPTAEQNGQSRADRDWTVLGRTKPTPAHSAYRTLCSVLQNADTAERDKVLDQVRAWSRTTTHARATHRTLTSEELRVLAGDGLVAIGAHSMEHPTLGLIPANRQLEEIGGSKRALQDIVGQSVTSFSYPFGRSRALRRDYTAATIDAVRRCAFTLACTTNSAVVTRRSGSYEIPRVVVRDWSGDQLIEHIRRRLPGLVTEGA